jgi:hypothetical protein
MSLFASIFWGLVLIVVGVAMIKYNRQITNSFFRSQAAEKYMGAGGSYLLWLMIGLVLVVIGIISLFGFGDDIARFILSPVTNLLR